MSRTNNLEKIRAAWSAHNEACGSDLWRGSEQDKALAAKNEQHARDLLFAVMADIFAPH